VGGPQKHLLVVANPSPGSPMCRVFGQLNAWTSRNGRRRRLASRAAHRTAVSADWDPSTPTTTARRVCCACIASLLAGVLVPTLAPAEHVRQWLRA
jgi:hypothetical protein